MTKDDLKKVGPGDIIQNKAHAEMVYIVSANFGDRITAVRTIELRDKELKEWDVFKPS
jgi:hypothetical protein